MNYFLALSTLLLAACTAPQSTATDAPAATANPAAAVTEAQAASIATRYFRTQPDSAVYQLATLRVLEAGSHWQVLVKRTDRAGRMPDNSAIEIDKQTGVVSQVLVK